MGDRIEATLVRYEDDEALLAVRGADGREGLRLVPVSELGGYDLVEEGSADPALEAELKAWETPFPSWRPASERVAGALLGAALGDALGVRYENMSANRLSRFLPGDLADGMGFASDDTEHAAMTVAAIAEGGGDPARFARAMARRLRLWFAAVPPGVGLATLKSCARLCLGVPPERSGVFSAGNGPLMRAPVIGAAFDERENRLAHVRAATVITHRDPKALRAADAVSEMTALASSLYPGTMPTARQVLDLLRPGAAECAEWDGLVAKLAEAMDAGDSPRAFAVAIGHGRGVSGYIYPSAFVAIHAWWAGRGQAEAAIREALLCGGDTDSVAAVTGALCGATCGPDGLPARLLSAWRDRPLTVDALRRHAAALDGGPLPSIPWPLVALRNLAFLAWCVGVIARRALPPY
jgi:ADP-ribosylglycohydrolase